MIVDQIAIDDEGNISYQGQAFRGHGYKDASPEVRLQHHLSNLLYGAFYTRKGINVMITDKDLPNDTYFLGGLKKANSSKERFDGGWTVEEIEHNGNIIVHKGGYRRYTFAGDFIRDQFMQGPLQRYEKVNIRVVPEFAAEEENANDFYYVFGETLLESNHASMVRIYFNISPQGAPELIRILTHKLNAYQIPFQFKCLGHPDLYDRCDSSVLYIDKRYVEVVGDLILEEYHHLKTWLRPEVPMFTLELAPGIAFAENPFASDESYGTSRCKLVAQALLQALKNEAPRENWVEIILLTFRKNFLVPDAPYLNPNSKYPYQFPQFQNA